MKLLIAATLSALTLAAGAQASHGYSQLADSVGVESNSYSLSQLALLKGLRSEDNNQGWINKILEHPEGLRGDLVTHHRTELDPNGVGWRSLAQSLGVEPGRYSPSQLILLEAAISDGDQARIAFIMSDGFSNGTAERPQVSSGAEQLARSLGVEPGLYSLNQLAQLKAFDGDTDNNSRLRRILENPAFD